VRFCCSRKFWLDVTSGPPITRPAVHKTHDAVSSFFYLITVKPAPPGRGRDRPHDGADWLFSVSVHRRTFSSPVASLAWLPGVFPSGPPFGLRILFLSLSCGADLVLLPRPRSAAQQPFPNVCCQSPFLPHTFPLRRDHHVNVFLYVFFSSPIYIPISPCPDLAAAWFVSTSAPSVDLGWTRLSSQDSLPSRPP